MTQKTESVDKTDISALIDSLRNDESSRDKFKENPYQFLKQHNFAVNPDREVVVVEQTKKHIWLVIRELKESEDNDPLDNCIRRANNDPVFLADLQAAPHRIIQDFGINIPDEVEITVVRNSNSKQYVVLDPLERVDERLSDDVLDSVAGGGKGWKNFMKVSSHLSGTVSHFFAVGGHGVAAGLGVDLGVIEQGSGDGLDGLHHGWGDGAKTDAQANYRAAGGQIDDASANWSASKKDAKEFAKDAREHPLAFAEAIGAQVAIMGVVYLTGGAAAPLEEVGGDLAVDGAGDSALGGAGDSALDGAGGSGPDVAGGSGPDVAGGSDPDGAGGLDPDGAGGSDPDGAGEIDPEGGETGPEHAFGGRLTTESGLLSETEEGESWASYTWNTIFSGSEWSDWKAVRYTTKLSRIVSITALFGEVTGQTLMDAFNPIPTVPLPTLTGSDVEKTPTKTLVSIVNHQLKTDSFLTDETALIRENDLLDTLPLTDHERRMALVQVNQHAIIETLFDRDKHGHLRFPKILKEVQAHPNDPHAQTAVLAHWMSDLSGTESRTNRRANDIPGEQSIGPGSWNPAHIDEHHLKETIRS